ncbi:MAG TPA: phosphoribosylamine--glycine ligase [Vicinamibacterales bacterium]|nr:phosphoribosylamine--glycine ligase [Vicinamibacterales bacterium]
MRVLIAGGGGREHALAWRLGRERPAALFCAPGNPGIAAIAQTVPIEASDPDALLALTLRESIDLTVIGPELPLDRGVVDRFRAAGRRIFGPPRAAAQLECSKAFAKGFMARHGIPTARYRVCESSGEARGVVDRGEFGFPVVLKADGLAAGKGVVIAADRAAAHDAIRAAMDDRQFGAAGARLVVEECLSGPEVSFFALCDGTRALPIASAQDHKRIFDGDQGPNTGGMGAFAPSPLLDAAMDARIMREIVEPVLGGMRAEGTEYRGFLYAGLMMTCDGPKVIEYNVRFGDPEAQAVLPLIDGDFLALLAAAADGDLRGRRVTLTAGVSVGVVIAAAGYPGPVRSGDPIAGLEAAGRVPGVTVFHAGTARRGEQIVTAGGRVLTVVATAPDYQSAIDRAYQAASLISFDGMQYRRDIGRKAVRFLEEKQGSGTGS